MSLKILSIIITLFVIAVLWIVWQIKKVPILQYISKYDWGLRMVKNEYFKTMFKREKTRVKNVNQAVKMAKLRNQAENLKIYVIEVAKGRYWLGTMREWNMVRKEYPKLKGFWPPRDAVFQTR